MKKLLKSLCFLVLVLVCFLILPTRAEAAVVSSGTCGENLTWTLDDAGTLTISGTGDMYDASKVYDDDEDAWMNGCDYGSPCYWWYEGEFARNSSIKAVIIEDGVTSIGEGVFAGCSNLSSLTIGNGVTSIGSYAFFKCNSLQSIVIPDNVTSIDSYAFCRTTSKKLSSLTIGTGLKTVSEGAFSYDYKDCYDEAYGYHDHVYKASVRNVYIKDIAAWWNIQFESNHANPALGSSTTVHILDDQGLEVTELFVENTETIDANMFRNFKYVKKITLGNDVKTISNYAFSNCAALEEITIPDSVVSIGAYAFNGCKKLKSISIPDSVTTIGERAFYGCDKLTTVTLGNQVKTIGCEAFGSCAKLKSIVIPKSVTEIGDSAFEGCNNLTSATINGNNATIGAYAFYKCKKLETVTIGNGVNKIGGYAFYYCPQLTTVRMGSGVKTIGAYSFYECVRLTTLTIPKSLKTIQGSAFAECLNLKNIYYSGKKAQWTSIDVEQGNGPLALATVVYGNLPKITTQPKNVVVAKGDRAKTTLKASGDGLTYTWYYAKKGEKQYTKALKLVSNYFSITMAKKWDGCRAYCVITDKYGTSVKSDVITLHMGNPVKITKQPTTVVVAKGSRAKSTLTASGDGLTYTWYYAKKGEKQYTKALKLVGNYFSITMAKKWDGCRAYCVITDKYGNEVTSNEITLYMGKPAKITTQPKNVVVAKGERAKSTLKASGDGLTYTWYYAKKGEKQYTKALKLVSNYFSITMAKKWDGCRAYCVITDKYGTSVKSDVITLYMGKPAKITSQPKNVVVAKGERAKTTLKASGDGLTYTWYYAKKGETKYTKAQKLVGNYFSITMAKKWDGCRAYCVITDKYGNSVKSQVVTLKQKK